MKHVQICKHLQPMGMPCLNEMKQMEISREHEIEKLKISDENNEMYINLLRSRKEMNMEFQENTRKCICLQWHS